MIRLALIGRGIQHTLSPEIYKRILGDKVSYDLLDYSKAEDVPSAAELFKTYQGINITSPYKKIFLNQVELTENARKLGAINCLKKEGEKIMGENTDYLAILDILTRWKLQFTNLQVALLGDGVMAGVTKSALDKLCLKNQVFSRRMTPDFSHLNLKEKMQLESEATLLVINTCAREYVFNGVLPDNSLFWDYNYNFEPHSSLSSKTKLYVDGREMLNLQAEYAVAFWSFNISKDK